jgi:hypothetical protein
VRAGGAIARELEHPRPERGEHAALRRHGGLGGVELVEVLAHRGQGPRIALADHRPVAGAEPEHEATRMVVVKRRAAARHVLGQVHPDVQDPGRHRDRRRRLERAADVAEHVAAGVGQPHRAVAERLELGDRRLGSGAVGVVAKRAAPDPDPAEPEHYNAGMIVGASRRRNLQRPSSRVKTSW